MHENYKFGLDYLGDSYQEVGDGGIYSGYEFYRELFPDNQNAGETGGWKSNAIYIYQDGYDYKFRRRIMLNDTWDEDYMKYVRDYYLVFCGGLSYRGKNNTLKNARRMHAMIFDLDDVGRNNFLNLFQYMTDNPTQDISKRKFMQIPIPTFIALSGKGIHLYYVFEYPLNLYPYVLEQLQKAKHELTDLIWKHDVTSQIKKPQYQGINQGFRMVGSFNSNHGAKVRAFRTGERVTLDYINKFLPDELKVDSGCAYKPSVMSLAEASEQYPEWYRRVVVEKNAQPKKWNIAGQKGHKGDELYNWWFNRRFDNELVGGHRYSFLYCLAAYARKCDISKERLQADMQTAFHLLKEIKHDNEFTQDDVRAAIKAYDKDYYNMTIAEIEYKSGLHIERNKRNTEQYNSYLNRLGDKALPRQKWHLNRARAVQDINYPEGEWREGNGRPSARRTVEDYRQENPDAKPKDCIRDTGLSKNTVYKWWGAAAAAAPDPEIVQWNKDIKNLEKGAIVDN